MSTYTIPTEQELHEFMDAINTGREALGLERIEKLDYDQCKPDNVHQCLSATHLYCALPETQDAKVMTHFVSGLTNRVQLQLAEAFDGLGRNIPDEITTVTEVFDASKEDPELHRALREAMVQAGIVEADDAH